MDQPLRVEVEPAALMANTLNVGKSRRVTIRDVAEAAAVSTATVSNVVNNTGSVSEATKQKVKAAIQSTKWKPNVNARNLARHVEVETNL
jgi:DNA-binding LacI/PurR family transcriptional regulator